MAFERDRGTCCLLLPLKLGVGIIAMLVFSHAFVCVLALVTGDIRFQPNGYSEIFYRVPSTVGAFGIPIGFLGLLGIYDDKVSWLKVFNGFLLVKLLAMGATMAADYLVLYSKCDGWMASTERLRTRNLQLEKLSEAEVCPWARWAYLLGAGIDFSVWAYFLYCCYSYQYQVEHSPGYPIDFGKEIYTPEDRWRLYHVKDPRPSVEKLPVKEEGTVLQNYGSVEEDRPTAAAYGLETPAGAYGPDGERLQGP